MLYQFFVDVVAVIFIKVKREYVKVIQNTYTVRFRTFIWTQKIRRCFTVDE